MKLLGIEIKHPPTGELVLLAAWIVGISVLVVVGHRVGVVPESMVAPMVSAMAAGSMLAAFGVSIARDGWRAVVLTVASATALWLLLTTFGLL